jgi:hypothetical protein
LRVPAQRHLTATALLERLIDDCDGNIRDELFFELERQLTVHAMAEEHVLRHSGSPTIRASGRRAV